MSEEFDVLVIGAGQGGALAQMLAIDDFRAVVVEKARVGSSCINIARLFADQNFAQFAHQMRRCEGL
jgi:flavin-dependent dehydrogenase